MPLRSLSERILQTVAFELGGLLVASPLYATVFGMTAGDSITLMAMLSLAVVVWTPLHNTFFDVLDYRHSGRVASNRPHRLRILQATSLQVTSTIVTLPIIMSAGGHSLMAAIQVDLMLTGMWVAYAYLFYWVYDCLWPIPVCPPWRSRRLPRPVTPYLLAPAFRVEPLPNAGQAHSHAEMLGEFQSLSLIVGAETATIEPGGPRLHPLEHQPTDDLAVFKDEGRLVAPHFQDPARSLATHRRMAETGIEEAGVVHPEFADHRQVGCHLCGIVRRNGHGLAADQDIEGSGVKDDAPVAGPDLLPEIGRGIMTDLVEINDARMRLGAIADQIAGARPQIDREAQPFGNRGLAVDKPLNLMQRHQLCIGEDGLAVAEANLVEPHTGTHQHGKRPRADFRIERACIAMRNTVELYAAINDRTGQQIQPAG